MSTQLEVSTPSLLAESLNEQPRSAGLRAYELLKAEILSLTLQPGRLFSESEIATRHGISKPTVREALARLRRDGLVESMPRSGYRVTPVTVKDARDFFALRTLLEGESAALAAGHAGEAEHLWRLDELCRAHYDPTSVASIVEFLRVNEEFHLAVSELGGNRRLTEQLAGIIQQLQRYMHLGLALSLRAEQIVHEHRELLAAILAGDAVTARAVAVEQATASHRMVIDGLLNSEAIQSTNLVPAGRR